MFPDVKIREERVNGLEIFIVDRLLDEGTVQSVHDDIMGLPFHFGELDFKGDEYPISAHELDPGCSPPVSHLSRSVLELTRQCFPGESHELHRCYVNMVRYGDMTYPHTDASRKSRDVTAVYFANASWHRKFGGETHFYDVSGDNRCAVLPKPGRLALFRGALEHNGSTPTRVCTEPRFTVVFKFNSH